MSFVGVKEVDSPDALRKLLDQLADGSGHDFYFLRWPHQVSGFQKNLPHEFPSPEGQMFNHDRELRWKQHSKGFSVLMLSIGNAEQAMQLGFSPIGQQWRTQKKHAHVYPGTETRFPQVIKAGQVDIAQRYFIDQQTSTVHFVALTVKHKL